MNEKRKTFASHEIVHITHRLMISPAAAVELAQGLNSILKALSQAQTQAQKAATQHVQVTDSLSFDRS
jgi:hypothetical protein